MECFDILIIGGGIAGLSAAKAAYFAGCRRILLCDRQSSLGGVLRQCIHHGFGEGFSGPEYIGKLMEDFPEAVTVWRNATVTAVRESRSARILGPDIGDRSVSFRQLILAAGCREIPMGALPIVGTRPAGVYTAGQMQEMMNLHGFLPEGPVVILGSGDLGLIMAEQLSQRGMMVTLIEQKKRCGGMAKNQGCLRKPNVHLQCNVTVAEVFGAEHIERIQLTDGSNLGCKTLLIAVGLQPEREVIHGLGHPDWLQICGNCKTVHPMVEAVVKEGTQAGIAAWERIRGSL